MSENVNFIIDILKTISGYIIVAIAGVLVGLFITLNATDKSCYLKIEFGNDKLELLKPDIADYDFRNLPEISASALATRIKNLEYDDVLSIKLRDLRDNFKGPFKDKRVDVNIKFIDGDDKIKNQTAGSYQGDLLTQQIMIFCLIEPKELGRNFSAETFDVTVESIIPNGVPTDIVEKMIFIDKKYAYEWLKIEDEDKLPNMIKAKASIIRQVSPSPILSNRILVNYIPNR